MRTDGDAPDPEAPVTEAAVTEAAKIEAAVTEGWGRLDHGGYVVPGGVPGRLRGLRPGAEQVSEERDRSRETLGDGETNRYRKTYRQKAPRLKPVQESTGWRARASASMRARARARAKERRLTHATLM